MKKLVFMLAAVLTFGMASAQTEPATVQKEKKTSVTKQEKVKTQKEAGDTPVNTTGTTTQPVSKDAVMQDTDPAKDHVKATPAPKSTTDTVATRKARKTTKSKRS